jgi:predicted  nucleic acid-binding Zn-ribbon protein
MGDTLENSVYFLTRKHQDLIKEFDAFKAFKDKFSSDFSKLEDEIKSIYTLIETVSKNSENLKSHFAQIVGQQSSNHEELKKDLIGLKQNLDLNAEKFKELGHDALGNAARITRLENTQSNFSTQSDNNFLLNSLNIAKSEIEKLNSQINIDLKNAIDNWKKSDLSNIQFMKSIKDELLKKNDDIKNQQDILKSTIEEHKNSMINQVLAIKDSLTTEMIQAIASIPKPIIPSLDDAKAAMQKDLVPVSLDAKNANLRSTNNEIEINTLKKKVESLLLMIKNFEIQEKK